MSLRSGALLLALAGPAAPAAAVTLADAIDAAAALDPGAPLSAALGEEGRALAAQSDSLFAADPRLSVQHFNDAPLSDDGAREWEAGIAAPVWLPGQRAARRAVAAAAAGQSEAAARARRWELAGQVREIAWEVALARARAEHQLRALEDARRLETAVERRVRAGELPQAELLLARRETLNRESEWLAAGAARSQAESSWRFHTGLDQLPADLVETPVAASEVDATHPGLALPTAEAERAASEQRRAASERRASPVLNLGARRERGPAEDSWNDALALGIEVPFGLPSQSAPALAAARVAATESGVARMRAGRALQEQLLLARGALELAERELDLARQGEVLATQSLRFAEAAFDLGEEDLFKLLQIRAQALAAAWNAERLALGVGRAAARFNQAAGLVP